jgi:hypothetical protein
LIHIATMLGKHWPARYKCAFFFGERMSAMRSLPDLGHAVPDP